MAPKFYTLKPSPPCRAVLITAKAIGLTLEEHEVDFVNGEHRTPEYMKLNPQHTVPTFDDNGNVICDSHAINAYLVGKYGKDDSLYPKDFYKRALVDQRLAFDIGVLFPILRIVDFAYMDGEIKSLTTKMEEQIKEAYDFLETFLKGKNWVACDCVTIADFSCMTTVTALDYHVPVDPKTYPNISAWIKRVQALPCCSSDHEGIAAFKVFFDAFKS